MTTDMKVEIERDTLHCRISLRRCKNCSSPMLANYSGVRSLPGWFTHQLTLNGVKTESYRDWGVCDDCVKKGGFPRQCAICAGEFRFPEQFAFDVTTYPSCPDDETNYSYVCKGCLDTRPHDVIEELLGADDVEDLRHT